MSKQVKQLDRVIIRFAGDSGDGMQLTGDRFTQESAAFGNDLVTLPNFPAEIRAPQGTLPGVSSFQVHFADHDILTAGDAPDVLVAMNPAALKANLGDLPKGATIIVDTHDFTDRNLTKAGYDVEPARRRSATPATAGRVRRAPGRPDRDDRRGGQGVRPVPQGRRPGQEHVRARAAVVDVRPPDRDHDRRSWASGSPRSPTSATPTSRRSRPAGTSARPPRRSWSSTRSSRPRWRRAPTATSPATWRWPTGWSPAACSPGSTIFLGTYPITPASDILHELSQAQGVRRHDVPGRGRDRRHRRRDRRVVRRHARASPPPPGPGIALKSEAIGLAVMTELPLLVIDVQRGGPSTGLPTKTEQADLLQAMFGRNGEAPVPIVAPQSPGDCFDAAVEAIRIAVTYRTPVMLLSDGYLANGSEPWRIPDVDDLPDDRPRLRDRAQPRAEDQRRRHRRRRSSGPTCATRRPWPGRGRSPARPASSTASAASRRATGTATSPTTRPTTT